MGFKNLAHFLVCMTCMNSHISPAPHCENQNNVCESALQDAKFFINRKVPTLWDTCRTAVMLLSQDINSHILQHTLKQLEMLMIVRKTEIVSQLMWQ